MGDHFSSPRVFADPAADITDIYAFPARTVPVMSCSSCACFLRLVSRRLFSDPDQLSPPGPSVTTSSTGGLTGIRGR